MQSLRSKLSENFRSIDYAELRPKLAFVLRSNWHDDACRRKGGIPEIKKSARLVQGELEILNECCRQKRSAAKAAINQPDLIPSISINRFKIEPLIAIP
ncbi:hypothetical protein EVAR_3558_1 [Eumeta japonica]|uniref:Uncharacterized protein n=1 Tax=Eumeta variegata TaxID=151549 RepID=A0A4C1SY50_EUMVA|nr:hypothetical protein EVAR_3558_1 [Eumeta japonica]